MQKLPGIVLRLTVIEHRGLHVHLNFGQWRVESTLEEDVFEAAAYLLLQFNTFFWLKISSEEHGQILNQFLGLQFEHALKHGGVFGRTHCHGGIFEITSADLINELEVLNAVFPTKRQFKLLFQPLSMLVSEPK